jgi:uncharacterized delta-60 repeat protein
VDGKIIVAGGAEIGGNFDFALVRYNGNGSLDNGFGSFGRIATDIAGASADVGLALKIQADGRIVVAGYTLIGANHDVALARYNANGSLDTSFDGDGKLTTSIGLGTDYAVTLALQSDGRILVAGAATIGSNSDLALVRYEPNGALDHSYGFGGKALVDFEGGTDAGYALAFDASGRAVVAGEANARLGVARVLGDGTVDVPAVSVLPATSLLRVSPNPTAGVQTFVVSVAPGRAPRGLDVFTAAGQRVWSRDCSQLPVGIHRLEWNGRGPDGRPVPPGVYFAKMQGASSMETRRFVRIL